MFSLFFFSLSHRFLSISFYVCLELVFWCLCMSVFISLNSSRLVTATISLSPSNTFRVSFHLIYYYNTKPLHFISFYRSSLFKNGFISALNTIYITIVSNSRETFNFLIISLLLKRTAARITFFFFNLSRIFTK